ncbi:MAG TPA: hypothetical protein VK688_13465 [Gemmatimonadales bacterium]|jgi:hypothetical protein|nr:hypothetical protein [Gemmatimonadales bacterium]
MRLTTLGLVAALAVAVPTSPVPLGQAADSDGQTYGVCTAARSFTVTDAEARAGQNESVVPVIIHMMMSDVPPQNRHWPRDPSLVWDRSKVQEYFAPQGRVNQIWSQAGVRIAVVRIDECPYSPAALRPDHVADVDVATPLEAGWEHFFGEIASHYNARDRAAVNIYVWVKVGIRKFASAYGTSPRRPPSAVWVDVFCALSDDPATPQDEQKMDPLTCARKLAHEIGHALTLRHLCDAAGGDNADSDADLPPCTQFPNSFNLMHPKPENGRDAEYRRLTSDQQREAAAAAKLYPQR